jgi:biotin transport system substrate-specific component
MKKLSSKPALSIKHISITGVMTAVICILGPLSVPLPTSPVPLSLTSLAICLSVFVLGMKYGTVSYLIYLFLGIAGLPVFSAFTGGIGKLAGPTGGYLIGFIFLALISGFFIEHFPGKYIPAFIGMAIGNSVCYLFGTIWLAFQMNLSFSAALAAGVLPYLAGDILKMIISAILGLRLRKAVLHLT